MSSCSVTRFSDGNIDKVFNQDGTTSVLYEKLKHIYEDEIAFEIFSLTTTDEFAIFNGESNTSDNVSVEKAIEYYNQLAVQSSRPLSNVDKEEVDNIASNLGFISLSSFRDKLKDMLDIDNVRVNVNKAIDSGIFTRQEIEDVDVEGLIELYSKIDRTLSIHGDTLYDEASKAKYRNSENDTIVGGFDLVSQNDILDEITNSVKDFRNSSEIDTVVHNLPYNEFIEEYDNNEDFREGVLKRLQNKRRVSVANIDSNGNLNTENSITYNTLVNTLRADIDFVSVETNIEVVEGIHNDVWKDNLKKVQKVLKRVESELAKNGIDIIGLSERVDSIDGVKEYLGALKEFVQAIENDTLSREDIKSFAKTTDEFFNRDNSTEVITVSEAQRGLSLFKLETTLSEAELFNEYGLIKVDDNLYQKVSEENTLEDLYAYLYSNFAEGSFDFLPITVKNSDMSTDEGKIKMTEQIKEYALGLPVDVNIKDREKYALLKIAFGIDLGIRTENELASKQQKISNIKDEGVKYLKGDFVADFYQYVLDEKIKDSFLYNSVLKHFKFTENGIDLTGALSNLNGIEDRFRNSLENYIRLRKDSYMDHLLSNDSSVVNEELVAVNMPELLQELTTDFSVEGGYVISEPNGSDYVKVNGIVYQKKLENEKAALYAPNVTRSDSSVFYEVSPSYSYNEKSASKILSKYNKSKSKNVNESKAKSNVFNALHDKVKNVASNLGVSFQVNSYVYKHNSPFREITMENYIKLVDKLKKSFPNVKVNLVTPDEIDKILGNNWVDVLKQSLPIEDSRIALLRDTEYIYTERTKVEYDETYRLAYKPIYVNNWYYADNTNPITETFETIDEALDDLYNAGDYFEVDDYYEPYKEVRFLLKEVWLDEDGNEYEDGDELSYEDFVYDNENHTFVKEYGKDDSQLGIEVFEKPEESASDLEQYVYTNIGEGIEREININGKKYIIEHSSAGKYSNIYVQDDQLNRIGNIQLRISNHTYNPSRNTHGNNFISVEINNRDKGRYKPGKHQLRFSGDNTFEEVVDAVNERIEEIIEGWNVEFLRDSKEKVYGFVKDSEVYLNINELNANTPIHEFTHVWSKVLPDSWSKGIELFKQTKEGVDLFNKIKKEGLYGSNNKKIWDEALTSYIGNYGEFKYNSTSLKKLLEWINNFFKNIGTLLGVRSVTPNVSLKNFVEDVVNGLLSGKEIKYNVQSTTLNKYDFDLQFTLLEESDFNNDGTVKQSELDEITKEKEFIKSKAIADGTFMKAPNGNDTNLTEEQWLLVRGKRFKNWFGDWLNNPENASKVVDKNGEPLVVYHGTTNEFYEFDSRVKGNIEGHLGKINYFTVDYSDAERNYLSSGADITSMIDRRTDEIEYDIENLTSKKVSEIYNIDIKEIENIDPREAAKKIAKLELNGGIEAVMELFVSLKNPVELGSKSVWFDVYNFSENDYNQAREEISEEYDISLEEAESDYSFDIIQRAIDNSGYEGLHVEALKDSLVKNGYDENLAYDILDDLVYEESIELNEVEKKIRTAELYENDNGEFAAGQVISDFFENLGFDGIILNNVSERFKNMGLNKGVKHIHIFDQYKNQIKSATDNVGTFSNKSNDIRFQISNKEKNAGDNRFLATVHNLTSSDIKNILRLGGLPVPSLAIIDVRNTYSSYGEISLIAGESLADPKSYKNKVFDADIYSPRYPSINIEFKRSKDEIELEQELLDLANKFKEKEYNYVDFNETFRGYPSRSVMAAYIYENNIKVERPEYGDAASKYFSDNPSENLKLMDWIRDKVSKYDTKEVFFDGFTASGKRRYLEHNLGNVVKVLTRGIKNGESFFYGAGNVRAGASKKFKTLQEIKNARDRIVSIEEMEDIKKSFTNELFDIIESLSDKYKYDSSSFSYGDNAKRIISDYASGKKNVLNEIYNDLTTEEINRIDSFIAKLKESPTEYFEAKPQRAVDLSEFEIAVLPKDTPNEIKESLKDKGLKIYEYNRKTEGDRQRVTQHAVTVNDIRFQSSEISSKGGNIKKLISTLKNTGLASDVIVDKNRMSQDLKERFGDDFVIEDLQNKETDLKFLRTNSGNILGYVTPEGVVFLDPSELNAETTIHEFNHLFNRYLMVNRPEQWSKIVELSKQTKLWNAIKNSKNYEVQFKGKEGVELDNAIADEVWSQIVGVRGSEIHEKVMEVANGNRGLFERIMDAIREYFNGLLKMFGFNVSSSNKLDLANVDNISMMVKSDLSNNKLLYNLSDKIKKEVLDELRKEGVQFSAQAPSFSSLSNEALQNRDVRELADTTIGELLGGEMISEKASTPNKVEVRDDLVSVAKKFETELRDYSESKSNNAYLGNPSQILEQVGMNTSKAIETNYSFVKDILSNLDKRITEAQAKSLARAIHNPNAVYTSSNGNINIITSVKNSLGENMLVELKEGETNYKVQDIRSVKESDSVNRANNNGTLKFAKEQSFNSIQTEDVIIEDSLREANKESTLTSDIVNNGIEIVPVTDIEADSFIDKIDNCNG
jgi:hypothetical protein